MKNLVKGFPEAMKVKLPEFAFTSIYGGIETDYNGIDYLFEQEEQINKYLSISNYSTVIKGLLFVYILVDKSKVRMSDDDYINRLSPKDKLLEIGIRLDFNKLNVANQQQIKQLMIQKYLWGIENLLGKRKDFDAKKFYADNLKLFEPYLKPATNTV